jgi:hypothetical protein
VALIVSVMCVLAVNEPEVPVIVRVEVPAAAVLPAVRVSILEPVVGFVPNEAVTPVGSPEIASVTLPVNPPAPATVMVSAVLLPGATLRVVVVGERVKLGLLVPGMVSAIVTE